MGLFDFFKSKSKSGKFVTESVLKKIRRTQGEMTPLTLNQLREINIGPTDELKLEYFFYTNTAEKAENFALEISKLDYSVKYDESAGDKGPFSITGWSTKMKMSNIVITNWTREMSKLGYKFDCEFDGWGTNPNQGGEEKTRQETTDVQQFIEIENLLESSEYLIALPDCYWDGECYRELIADSLNLYEKGSTVENYNWSESENGYNIQFSYQNTKIEFELDSVSDYVDSIKLMAGLNLALTKIAYAGKNKFVSLGGMDVDFAVAFIPEDRIDEFKQYGYHVE